MSSRVESHVIKRIAEAPVLQDPFPHCVIDEIFPPDFYSSISEHWPVEKSWITLAEASNSPKGYYDERFVVRMDESGYRHLDETRAKFWREISDWMLAETFRAYVLGKFRDELSTNGFDVAPAKAKSTGLIVSDRNNYAIGPHTDSPVKAATLLFYLPTDESFRRHGTSLYVPRDGAFRCKGGKHYEGDDFKLVKTASFVPNRVMAFAKSERSFHGVERVDEPGIERRLLICTISRK